MDPLVSVIIPTFNRAQTLRRAIDSVLVQSYQPVEVIVVDDGSTDATPDVLRDYDGRIRVLRQANAGPSAARNRGAAMTGGELLAFLDSDDAWQPTKLERQVRLLLTGGPQVPCCICNAAIIDGHDAPRTTFAVSHVASGLPQGFWLNPAALLATRFVLFNQVALLRRSAWLQAGGFNPAFGLLEDYDLALRLSLLGPWAFISDPLVVKYNDTAGIGVVAMQDPLRQANAWQTVLSSFLPVADTADRGVARLVRRALRDVQTEIRFVKLLQSAHRRQRWQGAAAMWVRRHHHALRRRLPGWPRVRASGSLPACEPHPNRPATAGYVR